MALLKTPDEKNKRMLRFEKQAERSEKIPQMRRGQEGGYHQKKTGYLGAVHCMSVPFDRLRRRFSDGAERRGTAARPAAEQYAERRADGLEPISRRNLAAEVSPRRR